MTASQPRSVDNPVQQPIQIDLEKWPSRPTCGPAVPERSWTATSQYQRAAADEFVFWAGAELAGVRAGAAVVERDTAGAERAILKTGHFHSSPEPP